MKKRDRVIVAVILAAALIVGLTLVRRALDLSAQAQADLLASAQFNGVGAASAEEAAVEPVNGLSDMLNEVAEGYQEVIDSDPFSGAGR